MNNNNQMKDDWIFLKDIYDILMNGKVLNTPKDEKIVEFLYPEELMKIFDFHISDNGISDHNEIRKICNQVIRYSVKTCHQQFHNQLFAGMDPFSLAGSWITDALNTSQYTYEVGPVFTLMENEIIQMFSKKFGYTDGDGIFSPGGSLSNFYGMVLARFKAIPNVKQTGVFGCQPLVAFTSDESHYSVKKAAHWLGIGLDNVIIIDSDSHGRMMISDLETKIQISLQENKKPFFVNATSGTTVLGAFDNLNGIADLCEKYNLWMHVDACLGGSAILSKKHCHLLDGINRSDSLAWNPHKTMGVPLQCSMFLLKHRGMLHACNSSSAQYLFQPDKFYDISYDTGDKSVQCGRKVDVFKFWLQLKVRGLSGMEFVLDNAMSMSQYLIKQLNERSGFRCIIDAFQYTNISFWYIPPGMRNEAETEEWWERLSTIAPKIKEKMVKSGTIMIGYSPMPNKNFVNFFRMVLTAFPLAEQSDLDFVIDEIERLGNDI